MRPFTTFAAFAVVAAVPFVACSNTPPPNDPSTAAASASASASVAPQGDLEKTDVVVGTGTEAKKGSAVSVHYTGTLLDGTVFDSSIERGKPLTFIIGNGSVIRGWEIGVVGMKVGGKRKLVIPPHLAYGDLGSPPTIPPRATLQFDIELLHVVD